MSLQRPLTEDEQHELDDLNAEVARAIRHRRDWLDAKMAETSALQPGDDIYDVRTGIRLGTVSELYRFWRDRDEGIRDTSVSCDYRYETSSRCYDNTSRQVGRWFGTQEDALSYAQGRVARLEQI